MLRDGCNIQRVSGSGPCGRGEAARHGSVGRLSTSMALPLRPGRPNPHLRQPHLQAEAEERCGRADARIPNAKEQVRIKP